MKLGYIVTTILHHNVLFKFDDGPYRIFSKITLPARYKYNKFGLFDFCLPGDTSDSRNPSLMLKCASSFPSVLFFSLSFYTKTKLTNLLIYSYKLTGFH